MKTIAPLVLVILLTACGTKKVSETQNSTDTVKVATDTIVNEDKLATIGFDLMRNEKFGEISMNLSSTEVIKAMGEPETKSDVEVSEIDGTNIQTWMYPSNGLSISFAEDENKKWNVISYYVAEKSTLKSTRGIGFGSSREDVLKAYAKEIGEQADENSIVAGTVYGGIVFWLSEEKVRSIFVGASAD